MSHLPHVFTYKEKMQSLGVTSPAQLAEFTNEAYISAILRTHFKYDSVLALNEDETARIWKQLDCWNNVSPINGAFIMATVKDRMNSVRVSLANTGRLPAPFTLVVVTEGTEGVDITLNEEYEVLVAYLMKELGAGHE